MNKIPECLIHPVSIKLLRQGHPWITADNFSNRFPRQSEFVIATDDRKRPMALLMHDPYHKNVKARVWSTKFPFDREAQHFTASIQGRLDLAFEKRIQQNELKERENYYLVFGEADQLPGLFILRLKDRVLIQLYTQFWNRYKSIIQTTLQEVFPEIKDENVWFQLRGETKELQKLPQNSVDQNRRDEFHIAEFGIQYLIRLGSSYDHGLYTDMSSIRHTLAKLIRPGCAVLNLYSYTGAFSLWAMKLGATQVTSVDLSPKYIEWLQQNLALNPELNHTQHEAIVSSVDEALSNLKKEEKKFDVIICDPPSSSSDGEKRTSASKAYKELLQKMDPLLNPKGKLVVFLNTHQVSQEKFDRLMKDYLAELKLNYKMSTRLHLGQDCPTLKGFPEGSYLKGLVLEKQ
ncbi:class I SAM-dependent rRNA methyltransferase [Peredibacter starrii]|uniref:Class I SAM-dependent methyltransferase n=1 Tax=Peredibacter starrii TaxID=28202 RepID=A0AAX4HM19_9BACT|nr:class I SAM-dependent methyltransferase [Peredibacter starrii]WPU64245.1 class I SAM-dependent methyltransferase [Peredibacter starrii]